MTIGALESLFRRFIAANELRQTLDLFNELCSSLDISTSEDHTAVFRVLSERFRNESSLLWKNLGKRQSNAEYEGGKACMGTKVS